MGGVREKTIAIRRVLVVKSGEVEIAQMKTEGTMEVDETQKKCEER